MAKYMVVPILLCLLGCASSQLKVQSRSSSQAPGSKELSLKGVGGFTLYGTLQMPEGKGPFPAYLLLPGSGPTDRDGNQGETYKFDTLKDIAAELAKKGVASFRFDKRAVASRYMALYPKTVPELRKFFDFNAFVGDAEAAFNTLKSQSGIDPSRVGVLGHSEGGAIALAMSQTSNPASLILVSTAGRDLGAVIIDQIEHGYSAQFTPPATLKRLGDATERIVKTVRDTGNIPSDVPTELAPLFQPYISDYLHQVFTFQPTEAASKYHGPVLVVQASKDIQVSPTKDGPILFAAFPKGNAEYYVAEGCSHILKHPSGPKDPGFSGPTDEKVLEKIADWASTAMKGSS